MRIKEMIAKRKKLSIDIQILLWVPKELFKERYGE